MDSFRREALELAAILDTMADGVFVIDTHRRIARWNRTMERLTGYSAAEAIGQPCTMFDANGDSGTPSLPAGLDVDALVRGAVDRQEAVLVRKDGMGVHVIASSRVMRDDEGQILGSVVTLTDIAPLKRLEHEVLRLRRQAETRSRFDNIIGKSRQMQEVFSLIEMAAASPVSVLIQGDTGTGKELVARAIHAHSERRSGPLVSVNCSALSESLLESELFGHVRGSFTGAVKDYVGRFERANGGTVFLDEIGDIPPIVQVKLLRVLQEREFERVGESVPRKADVRVIAATHRDLRERVREGLFREDLFYRLKVFPITLPPLRERKEDIGLLVEEFVRVFGERTGKRILGLNAEATRIIMEYAWPGNVRELENAVEHAFVTCSGNYIGPLDLPVEIHRVELRPLINEAPLAMRAAAAASVFRPRRRPPTREQIEALLEECGWNKAEAARRLGLTRTTIWRRMKALGMPLDPPM